MLFVSVEELDNSLNDYKAQKQKIVARNDEIEIGAKVKEYEKSLRDEYATKKQAELHEIDISIEAVERLKAKGQELIIKEEV